jgi:hypothetical protein
MLTPTVPVVDEAAAVLNMLQDVPAPAPTVSICSALLVSKDAVAIEPISESMRQLAISTAVCSEVSIAPLLLNHRKFGATIVDLSLGEQARAFLEKVRNSPSNRTSVMFAISDSDAETADAFKGGSNFVFRRPLTESSINQNVRAAYGLILREHRRYFRCPVEVPVALCHPGMPEINAHSVNISEGGMALSTSVLLGPGEEVQIQFILPGSKVSFSVESKICWLKTSHFGIRFVSLSREHKSELQDWLSRKLEEGLPDFVVQQFQKEESLR